MKCSILASLSTLACAVLAAQDPVKIGGDAQGDATAAAASPAVRPRGVCTPFVCSEDSHCTRHSGCSRCYKPFGQKGGNCV
ncbi:hypothetical protein CDD83_7440 [Cordyceps sp. RAO-2017]|nr:hypothetical protein CDD83_7440 [Cordyceps sp. RAO-2017]